MEHIILVNQEDHEIWSKVKQYITTEDIYRVSSLRVQNSLWEVLLPQRSLKKKHHLGKWWPIVEGTLEIGTDYKTKIISRAKQEVGINVSESDLKEWKKIRILTPYNHFNQNFRLIQDIDIDDLKLDTEEVHEVRWWKKQDLLKSLESSPERFVGSLDRFI